MGDTVEIATYDRAGVLVVQYVGSASRDRILVSPAPRPTAQSVNLHWDPQLGIVFGNAEPKGESFVLKGQAVAQRLVRALQLNGPIDVPVQAEGRPDPSERMVDRSGSGVPAVPSRLPPIDYSVFDEPIPGAFLLVAARHWTPLAPIPMAVPWSRAQVDVYVAYSPTSQFVADTVARTWREYTAAGGKQEYPYKYLVETLLVQAERKNPSASLGYLCVDRVPLGWGLYRSGNRWYDDKGFPVLGPGGVYWDHTYAPLEPPDWAIWVTVNDPEMFTLLTYLRQAIASDTLDVTAAAQGYAKNMDLLLPAVFDNWPFLDELGDELVQMLPLLAFFVGIYSMARLLMLTKSPALMAIGYALLAILKVAGCLLNVTFFGSIALNAIAAGRELLLVRRDLHGKLDDLGNLHLRQAASLVRKVLVDVATILVLKGGAEMSGRAGKSLAPYGKAAIRNFRALIQTRYGPALAGAYGEGPPFDLVAMEGEAGGGGGKSSGKSPGKSGVPERESRVAKTMNRVPVDEPPKNWRELENRVTQEFREGAPENGPNYFTSEKHQLSAIWKEFRAFVRQMMKEDSSLQDPLANAKPEVLDMKRSELIKGTDLAAECEARTRWFQARLAEAERKVSAAEPRDKVRARAEKDKWTMLFEEWLIWLDTKVGNQKLDLFELNPRGKQAAVMDPSFAWANRLHNLKSRVYLESLNRLFGWRGGSAIDIGNGRFQNRMFYGEGFETEVTPGQENASKQKK